MHSGVLRKTICRQLRAVRNASNLLPTRAEISFATPPVSRYLQGYMLDQSNIYFRGSIS